LDIHVRNWHAVVDEDEDDDSTYESANNI